MPHQKSKRILIYFFLIIILGTIHNLFLAKLQIPKIQEIQLVGLNKKELKKIKKDLSFLKMDSLFYLNALEIEKVLFSYPFVENFTVFKKFPSTLKIEIEKTQILANKYIKGSNFLIGSNGKLIKSQEKIKNKPSIFGNFRVHEFIQIKNIIDNSNLAYDEIESFFYFESKRWDIMLKNDILIKLPQKQIDRALELVIDLLLSKKKENIKIIDARLENQIILNEY